MDLNEIPLEEYRQLVREDCSYYYRTNDKAHRLDHADEVADTALMIIRDVEEAPNKRRECMAIAAAYCHDLFSKCDKDFRRNHHERAFEYVMLAPTPWLKVFTHDEIIEIALACREHRASWKGGYSNVLSKIIAAADRGMPDLDKYLYRAYLYGVDSLQLEPEIAIVRSIIHIHDKHGSEGCVRVPSLWKKFFSPQIEELRCLLDSLKEAIVADAGIILAERTEQKVMSVCTRSRLMLPGTKTFSTLLHEEFLSKHFNYHFSKVLKEKWFLSHR